MGRWGTIYQRQSGTTAGAVEPASGSSFDPIAGVGVLPHLEMPEVVIGLPAVFPVTVAVS